MYSLTEPDAKRGPLKILLEEGVGGGITFMFSRDIFFSFASGPGGGFSHWHGIRICACLLGHFFAKFGIAIGRFSSETKEPKLHKLGVFWANYCKKHPIWSKLGAFWKWYTDGWEIWQKIGIETVRFSRSGRHIYVRFWWKNPPPRNQAPGMRPTYKCLWTAPYTENDTKIGLFPSWMGVSYFFFFFLICQ